MEYQKLNSLFFKLLNKNPSRFCGFYFEIYIAISIYNYFCINIGFIKKSDKLGTSMMEDKLLKNKLFLNIKDGFYYIYIEYINYLHICLKEIYSPGINNGF